MSSFHSCVRRVLRSRWLAVVENRAPVGGHVSILLGKRSTKKQPPRVRPCEKGSSAAFEPRSADAERRADLGVTTGRVRQ